MNLDYVADALLHWKGSIFESLQREGLLRNLAVLIHGVPTGTGTALPTLSGTPSCFELNPRKCDDSSGVASVGE